MRPINVLKAALTELINKEEYVNEITVLKCSAEAYNYNIWLYSLLAGTYIQEAIQVFKEAIEVSKKQNFGK